MQMNGVANWYSQQWALISLYVNLQISKSQPGSTEPMTDWLPLSQLWVHNQMSKFSASSRSTPGASAKLCPARPMSWAPDRSSSASEMLVGLHWIPPKALLSHHTHLSTRPSCYCSQHTEVPLGEVPQLCAQPGARRPGSSSLWLWMLKKSHC